MSSTKRLREILTEIAVEKDGHERDRMDGKNIFIYGAGHMGSKTYEMLSVNKTSVFGFLDRRGGDWEYMTKPVFTLDDDRLKEEDKADSLVIISIFFTDRKDINDLILQIKQHGFPEVYYKDIIGRYLYDSEQIRAHGEELLKVDSFLEDALSRDSYCACIEAKLSGDFSKFPSPADDIQYFPSSFCLKKGCGVFVDCGAYTGDTLECALANERGIETYIGFEPDTANFLKLRDTVGRFPGMKSFLYPCGVSDQNEKLCFEERGSVGSRIGSNGNLIVQCVSLDSCLCHIEPTFVKMDIEGVEKAAILGMKQIIRESAPDLAISIYHRDEDMWELPLLIKSYVPDYKFYIRTHEIDGMETILYATR